MAAASELDAARIERRCGDLDAARAHYRRAIDAGASCDVALELSAIVDDEAELLARFVSEAPLTATALDELAAPHTCRVAALRLAALSRGADDDAPLRILAPLLAADPSDPDALAELAHHHLARNQLGAAAQVCAQIGEHAGGLFACGLVALKRGDLHVAERRLRAAVALDPDGPAVGPLADHLMASRRYAEALLLYHRLHQRAPRDYDALLNLGIAFTYTGCTNAARRAYHRATELSPERVEAWYDLGLLYRYDDARDHHVEYALALHRVLELAEGRPELTSLARSVRDEECLRRVPESRGGDAGVPHADTCPDSTDQPTCNSGRCKR